MADQTTVSNEEFMLRKLRKEHEELNDQRRLAPEEKKRKLLCKDEVARLETELRKKGVIQ